MDRNVELGLGLGLASAVICFNLRPVNYAVISRQCTARKTPNKRTAPCCAVERVALLFISILWTRPSSRRSIESCALSR